MKRKIKSAFPKATKEAVKPLIRVYNQASKMFSGQKARKLQADMIGETPAWYKMTDKGPSFMPDVLADHCAETQHVFCIADDFYAYDNGVYRWLNEKRAKNMVREMMLKGYIHKGQIEDAKEQWCIQVQKDAEELNTNRYLINVLNGIYDVRSGRFIEHSPEFLMTIQLPVRYTPGADCPRFKLYLEQQLEADQIPLIQEWLGYTLLPLNCSQKALVLVGLGDAGKSVLLRVIIDILLGHANVTNVSWQALNEKFKPAELYGKLANIFGDLPTKNIEDNGIFKALTGEDYMTVERKNRDPFSFQNFAKLVYSCNSIPRNYGDRSDAFYRRLCIVRFNRVVPKDKRDPDLVNKLKAEADGIFLFALEGLKRLMENNFVFSETQRNIDEIEQYRAESNSVLSFVNERCILDADAEESRQVVYDSYKKYCQECGMKEFAQKKFNAEVELLFPGVARAKDSLGKRRTWRGLKLDDQAD